MSPGLAIQITMNQIMKHRFLLFCLMLAALAAPPAAQPLTGLESLSDEELAAIVVYAAGYPRTPAVMLAVADGIRVIHGMCSYDKYVVAVSLAPEYKRVGPWTPLWKALELEAPWQRMSVEDIAAWFVHKVHAGVAAQLREEGCMALGGSHLGNLGVPSEEHLARLTLFMMDFPQSPALVGATVQNIRMMQQACPTQPKWLWAAAIANRSSDYPWSGVVRVSQLSGMSADETAEMVMGIASGIHADSLKSNGCPPG